MQAVQMSFPQQVPLGSRPAGAWRPARPQPRGNHMGWRPVSARPRPQMGQQPGVSISESARAAGGMLVGIAATVSGGIMTFASLKKDEVEIIKETRIDPESGEPEEVEVEKATWKKASPTIRLIGGIVMGVGLVVVALNFMKVSGTLAPTDTTAQR